MYKYKVGIMTFHRALNYGAVLQGYALQQAVQRLDCDCEIVDYRSDAIENAYKYFGISSGKNPVMSFAKGIIKFPVTYKRKKSFKDFSKRLLKTSKETYDARNIADANNVYDIFITGSDQVWSPYCAGFDENYFLTFASPEKKNSYAASFGCKVIPDDKKQEYYKRLHDYKSISIREIQGKDILSNIGIELSAEHSIDPTFLLSSEKWQIHSKIPKEKDYVLLFTVNKPIKAMNFAKSLAAKKNLKVIYINDKPIGREKGVEYKTGVSPEEFLGYIKNADYVVTNSFHGTAFSVIFHKQLYTEFETQTGYNSRADELLTSLGLSAVRITDTEYNGKDPKLDWNYSDEVITQKKNSAESYLKKMIEAYNE